MSNSNSHPVVNQDSFVQANESERAKWDSYYASLEFVEEDEITRQFNDELVGKISEFLPQGGRTLEAGSGGGWQSLALARTGRFETTVLDFSAEALTHSRRAFENNGLTAQFIQADIATSGKPCRTVRVEPAWRAQMESQKAVAKRLECDDDKARFEAKLGKLAKAKSPRGTKP